MAGVEALGLCEPCNLFTRFQVRFYDDGRYLVFYDGVWHTREIETPPVGWLTRVRGWLRAPFG